jgi:GTP-binding protein LepA
MQNIRNFSIIAHIDHGKSTLSDRFIELTNTVEKRKMQDQILDSMELERERGITIKMTPVRLEHVCNDKQKYIFNLIDTPGHIDFYYEVSRSLRAVEGAVLLIDATQGVQAQTMTVLDMAREANLTIIPVLNKIDSPLANITETEDEVIRLLKCDRSDIKRVSGKTGEGVLELLETIKEKIPAPTQTIDANEKNKNSYRGLVFDFEYSNHEGVIIYTRVLNGEIKKGDEVKFIASNHDFVVKEVGIFTPSKKEVNKISAGEVGYVVTGIKEPGVARVGDTITKKSQPMNAFPGYNSPIPLVFASVYPEFQEFFDDLRRALDKLRLSDSSFTYEEEQSGALGRGFRCGFLGMLHLEIITERLKREFGLTLIVTTPSITYEVTTRDGKKELIYTPIHFPDHGEVIKVREPWILTTIITPHDYVSPIMELNHEYEASVIDIEDWGDNRVRIILEMPLRELMRNYFDIIKSVSSGYASVAYEGNEMRDAMVTRMDLFVAEERVAAFSRVVPEYRIERDADEAVEKLFKILPKEWFRVKIQAYVKGRIIASRSLAALSKNVTAHMYGGDITRKMKLREKQKEGKKRMQAEGKVYISHDTFLKMMK